MQQRELENILMTASVVVAGLVKWDEELADRLLMSCRTGWRPRRGFRLFEFDMKEEIPDIEGSPQLIMGSGAAKLEYLVLGAYVHCADVLPKPRSERDVTLQDLMSGLYEYGLVVRPHGDDMSRVAKLLAQPIVMSTVLNMMGEHYSHDDIPLQQRYWKMKLHGEKWVPAYDHMAMTRSVDGNLAEIDDESLLGLWLELRRSQIGKRAAREMRERGMAVSVPKTPVERGDSHEQGEG